MIIGIDNGLKGGLVALNGSGKVVDFLVMPTHTVGNKNEIHVWTIIAWCRRFSPSTIVIEEPLHAAGSSQSLRSMAISFGTLLGSFTAVGNRVNRVQVHEWQTHMLPRGPKGTSKTRALAKARELWPEESWIPPRCKTPHDGVIDAALIAEYYRTHHANSH